MDSTAEKQASDSLLVLVTESQVHVFDLSHTFRVAIGRHESNELQLDSRTVSNYHAEILNENGRLLVRDLGSTNGTYINEERVREQRVASGDHLRIGSHVLTVQQEAPINKRERLLRVPRDPDAFGPGTAGRIVSIRSDSEDAHKTLQVGGPHDLPLADLLKTLSANAHSVLLTLTQKDGQGCVWVRKDRIVHAEYGSVTGEKALYRFFGWGDASYEVDELADEHATPRSIELPVDTLIVEGMKHASEIGMLLGRLPLEASLQLKEDCTLPPSAYTPAELQIFQAVIRYETVAKVMDTSPMTDTTVLCLIDALVRKGVFEVARRADGRLHETLDETLVRNKPLA